MMNEDVEAIVDELEKANARIERLKGQNKAIYQHAKEEIDALKEEKEYLWKKNAFLREAAQVGLSQVENMILLLKENRGNISRDRWVSKLQESVDKILELARSGE